ncbi:MAG: LacI family DNA-binding transcriptional regulator [Lautropia sp.]
MSRNAAPAGRIRLADVAAAAGVSSMTVSRAMREPERLHPDTLKRIRAKVEELGYLPNQSARSLASRRSRIVAAIVPTLSNSVYAGTLQGMSDALARFGFELMLADSGYDVKHEHVLVGAFIGRGVDALVLTGVEHDRATRELVHAHRLPVAEIWDLGRRPLGLSIGFSNHAAGEAVGRLLAELGRRRWGFIGSLPIREHRSQKRKDGLFAAADAAGIAPPACGYVDNGMSFDEAGLVARQLLTGADLDAVFCANDVIACAVLKCARDSGRRVPDDLAVVGFGDFDVAAMAYPALTTVRVPGYQMGALAAESLVASLAGEVRVERRVDLGFEMVLRETT